MAYKEKRREDRYNVNMTCTIAPMSKDIKVVDVSLHGMSIVGDVDLSIDHSVDIRIKHEGNFMALRAVVRNSIIWDGDYRYGLEVIVSPESWLELVYSCMKSNK